MRVDFLSLEHNFGNYKLWRNFFFEIQMSILWSVLYKFGDTLLLAVEQCMCVC